MTINKFISFIVAIGLITSAALAAEHVGTIVSLTGKASATAKDGTARTLEIKSDVFQNDKIKTEPGAALQIMFLDDSVLAQGEKSEMVVDEYVYNPNNKDDNKCTLNLGKGVFRAITARITALNPERFKVKTKFATIGIRGCEIGFTISEREENVYVLSLPDGKSVVVTLNEGVSGFTTGTLDKNKALELLTSGIMVHIEENGGVTQRPISIQEAIDIIEGFTLPDNPADNDLTRTTDQEHTENDLTAQKDSTLTRTTTPPPATPPATPPPATPPAGPTLVYTKQGGGASWEWGIWAYPGGAPVSVGFLGHSVIPNAVIASLMTSYPGYSLSGSGTAAAIVNHDGSSHFISGPCDLLVSLGSGMGNSWSADTFGGSGITDNKGTMLNFRITGTVSPAGALQGSIAGSSDYFLSVGGSSFILPQTQSISANLTESAPLALSGGRAGMIGGSANPDGIIGRFTFTHNGGTTTVRGGFGSNLSNNAF